MDAVASIEPGRYLLPLLDSTPKGSTAYISFMSSANPKSTARRARNASRALNQPPARIGSEKSDPVVAESIHSRTLGEVVAALPFSGVKLKPLTVSPLPGPGLPEAYLPRKVCP